MILAEATNFEYGILAGAMTLAFLLLWRLASLVAPPIVNSVVERNKRLALAAEQGEEQRTKVIVSLANERRALIARLDAAAEAQRKHSEQVDRALANQDRILAVLERLYCVQDAVK